MKRYHWLEYPDSPASKDPKVRTANVRGELNQLLDKLNVQTWRMMKPHLEAVDRAVNETGNAALKFYRDKVFRKGMKP
jgi:hypothetical protein